MHFSRAQFRTIYSTVLHWEDGRCPVKTIWISEWNWKWHKEHWDKLSFLDIIGTLNDPPSDLTLFVYFRYVKVKTAVGNLQPASTSGIGLPNRRLQKKQLGQNQKLVTSMNSVCHIYGPFAGKFEVNPSPVESEININKACELKCCVHKLRPVLCSEFINL